MIKIPQVENISVDKLSVDGNNPNKLDVNQCIALKNNIKKFGFLIPIITNKHYTIADGEHRWNAARELNMKEVPVIALTIKEEILNGK